MSQDNVPLENNDDVALRILGGATFGPRARLTLPSGAELGANEANAFTAAFDDGQASEKMERLGYTTHRPDPLSSENDKWTSDPQENRRRLVDRAKAAFRKPRSSQQ